MFTVIGLMLCGILVGYLARKHELSGIGRLITSLIWILLFLLGVEVGSNQKIIEGLATLGIEALTITFAAVLGSCLAAWALWYFLYKRKEGQV